MSSMNPSQAESDAMAAYLERILGDWVTFVMGLEKQMREKTNRGNDGKS